MFTIIWKYEVIFTISTCRTGNSYDKKNRHAGKQNQRSSSPWIGIPTHR